MDTITLPAHAKMNLVLDVCGRRPDGYHQVETILQSLELADRITVRPAEEIFLQCGHPLVPEDRTNLAWQAAQLILGHCGCSNGVFIHIEKRIPVAAGLAGGSSDAAATLRAINSLLGLGLDGQAMLGLAAELGSDVPFCLQGGTALATGRGEALSALPAVPEIWAVLVKPPAGLSTAVVYREWDALANPWHPDVNTMLLAIARGDRGALLAGVGNSLAAAAIRLYPEISTYLDGLRDAGAAAVLLCGSGPTCAGLAATRREAERLAAGLPESWQAIVTRTITAETATGGA